jgi:hypothetical protein
MNWFLKQGYSVKEIRISEEHRRNRIILERSKTDEVKARVEKAIIALLIKDVSNANSK